jgi:hypothetical protein
VRSVKTSIRHLLALATAGALLAGCAANGSSTIPSTSQAPLTGFTLEFAVGTAVLPDGTTGLNTVATLRSGSGSAVLADVPTITGPAGFTVPAGVTGAYGPGNVDAGTAKVTSSPQVPQNQTPANTTLGTFTGVFGYGFGPFNSDNALAVNGAYMPGNPNNTPGNGFTSSVYYNNDAVSYTPTQPLPLFATPSNQMVYLGGPPAYPFFKDGTYPGAFAGFSQGFYTFEAAPVAGTYNLSVAIPAVNAPAPAPYTASASLTNTTPLGAVTVSGIIESGNGMSGTVTVPAGVTETMVYALDVTTGMFYTAKVAGTGAQVWSIPGNLGACNGSGCQNSAATQKPSFNSGDSYAVSAVGYDYPAFEAGPPNTNTASPTITGANGQADLTMSAITTGTY